MKQRMITVACGVTALIIVLLFYKTMVLNVGVALISILAVHEIFGAAGISKSKALIACCYIYAAVLPFSYYCKFSGTGILLTFALLLALFSVMLKEHETVRVESMALCFMVTVLITASLTGLIFIRDNLVSSRIKDLPVFYIALAFIGSWITDGGGYIFGTLMGKHKLSPKISPKKTIEGAVGGIVSAVVFSVLFLFGYGAYLQFSGITANYNYLSVIILALACAVVSIVGDLSASIIKRQNNIKDYGTILPGHGGILDRFDSILFVVPLIIVWMKLFPIVF